MIDVWELQVWSPTGAGPRVIPRDASYIRSTGLRMQLTPEQDCREAAFEARGDGLGIGPLDCVQVVYGGVPLYYGEVRAGGNVRDTGGHSYTLRSLVQCLKEVTLSPGFATPQQPAHLTVQAILRDVQATGALGSPPVIEFDPDLCPDLGFDCRAVVDAHQQTAASLLERIAEDGAAYGVTVRYGVRPDRRFFCRAADTGVRAIEQGDIASLTWQEPVAETPVTAVLWYVLRDDDGVWLTHLSQSPEAALYRRRVKAVSWAGEPPLRNAVGSPVVTVGGQSYRTAIPAGLTTQDDPPYHPQADIMGDGISHANSPKPAAAIIQAPPGQDVTLDIVPNNQGVGYEYDVAIVPKASEGEISATMVTDVSFGSSTPRSSLGGGETLTDSYVADGAASPINLRKQVVKRPRLYASNSYSTERLRITALGNPETEQGAEMRIYEARMLELDTPLLDRLARYYYQTPAQTPADIELRTFIPPAELPKYITLNGWQSIVDGWEYRLTAERGMTLACLAGQAEDPASLAQAELIKARDGRAVIEAISVGGKTP